MKILVIGSSGFIGSHLCRYFMGERHEVTGCDIKPPVNDELSFILIPNDNQDFSGVFDKEPYDICINASGSASVPYSITNPAEDFRLNVTNVYLLLHKIRKHQPACRFLNFSSAAVYGNPDSLPIIESMSSAPLSPYGFHKMLSEHICNEFYKLYQISTCCLRVFSAYGPGLRKQLFWDLVQKAKISETVELFGSGFESRDFIYIDDLVSAVDIILLKASFTGEAINVAGGKEINIRHVAETFLNYYKPGAEVKFSGIAKPGDPLNWVADISKLKTLGFDLHVSFEEGVKRYCDWLREKEW
jgi:UDP-glucose 4-epimerase